MISLLVECYGFISIFNLNISFDSIVQIEIFLLTILITVLTIRIALIDTESKAILQKINKIFDEYEYDRQLLFEEQMDVIINDFYKHLQKRDSNQIEIEKGILDWKKIKRFLKQYKSLKQFRQEHIEAIRPISLLIALLIVACLILGILDLNDPIVALLTLKLATIGMTVYTIYETLFAALYILKHPFTKND